MTGCEHLELRLRTFLDDDDAVTCVGEMLDAGWRPPSEKDDARLAEFRRDYVEQLEKMDADLAAVRAERDEAMSQTVFALRERDEARQALTEVHEYQCGCARPGDLARCVAQPIVIFQSLPVPARPEQTT